MTTNETKQHNRTSLKPYLEELAAGEAVPRLENETWEAMMARISGYRGLSEIDEEAYFWFLEVLPPRIMTGSFFCFAEGMESESLTTSVADDLRGIWGVNVSASLKVS